MAEILLTKQEALFNTESDKEAVRRFLFRGVDGVREEDKRAWRKFWKKIAEAEAGEIFTFDFWFERSGGYHRRHFAMIGRLYRAQERFGDFEGMRLWLKIGAGFVDWHPGPKGGIVPIPRSISFRKLDEAGMREFHDASVAFLRTAEAQKTLWPHVKAAQRAEACEAVLQEFGE